MILPLFVLRKTNQYQKLIFQILEVTTTTKVFAFFEIGLYSYLRLLDDHGLIRLLQQRANIVEYKLGEVVSI